MKDKICILAFDDGPHLKEDLAHNRLKNEEIRYTPLVGVVCKGNQLLYVLKTTIQVDGIDSTQQILKIIEKNPFRKEVRLIMINSPTVGGFNPPNAFGIYNQTKIPILLIPEKKPQDRISEIYAKVFPERKEQIQWLEQLNLLEHIAVKLNSPLNHSREIYFHAIGITKQEIGELLQALSKYSGIPEPLRLAHIIASSQIIE